MMTSRVALIGLISILPATALADDSNWYFSLRGGLSSAEKSALDNPVNGLRGHSDHKNGFALSGAVGYDFGGARIEGEVLRIENKVDTYGFSNDGGLGAGLLGANNADSGKTNVTAGMMNLYYDIDTGTGLTPYVGGGVGWGRTKFNDYSLGATNIIDDADKGLAYQLIAGLRAAVNDAIDVTADYRYFGADNPNYTDALGRNVDSEFDTHLFMVGIVWKFGGEKKVASTPEPVRAAAVQQPVEPEPAPVVEPYQEVEPAAGPEPVEPIVVYFDWDSADLSAQARNEIAEAADLATERAPVKLLLKGYADTTGSDYYNIELSTKRAKAVQDALIAAGVPADSISTWGYGEGDLAVWTDNDVRERMNRRVQIIFE